MKYFARITAVALAMAALYFYTAPSHADELTKSAATATELLSSIVDGVKNLTATYGKPATELALETVRMKSVQGLLYAGMGSLLLLLQLPLWYFALKIDRSLSVANDEKGLVFLPAGIVSLITIPFGLVGFLNLVDAKLWYGLYHPEVVLASDVIAKVLGN